MNEKKNRFNWALVVLVNVVCGILFVSLSTLLISTGHTNPFLAFLASMLFVAGSFFGLPFAIIVLIMFQYRLYVAWRKRSTSSYVFLSFFFLIPCLAILYQSIRFASVDWLLVSSFMRAIVWSMSIVALQIWLDSRRDIEHLIYELWQA